MKRALITGASSGIGEALAHFLAKKQIKLILSGRNTQKLNAVAQSVGAEEEIVADLATDEGRDKVAAAIQRKQPDLVINNAGFTFYGDALSLPIADQLAIAEVNGIVPLHLTLVAIDTLVKAGKQGVIMNISSSAGEYPVPGMSVYGAAKAFVTQFSQAINTEVSGKGIHVLVACPGMVDTAFAQRAARKTISQNGGPVMSATYAAREIWRQIEKKQEKHVFNWQYRLGLFVARNFVPTSVIKKLIWKQIQKRQ